jgi:hypothetical protein
MSIIPSSPSSLTSPSSGQQAPIEPLPIYPGLTIGSVIKKTRLQYPILQQKLAKLIGNLQELESENARLEASCSPGKTTSNHLQMQLKSNKFYDTTLNRELSATLLSLERISKTDDCTFAIDEVLPLDQSLLHVATQDIAFESDTTRITIISNTDTCEARVNDFFNLVFQKNPIRNLLPEANLHALVADIKAHVTSSHNISLVASYITLRKVKKLEFVKLRKGARLNESLKSKSDDYYVVTEVKLGGVFLGYGSVTQVAASSLDSSDTSFLKNVSLVHYLSQGAIPDTTNLMKNCNMFDIYSSWKKQLCDGTGSGFPVEFRVLDLKNILIENDMLTSTPAQQ